MSSYPEDGYKTMLASFRTNDLQTLLGAFGRNKAGRKSELKDRAVDLLRNRPPGFNSQAYVTKIIDIYRSMQNDVPNNDVLRTLMQNQTRQMISLQSQRMYPPPQYNPQSMHLTRAGLPQVMPQMSRGMYSNNMGPNNANIQYSYQPTMPRNMSQVPSQQLNMMSSESPMSYNMNVGGVNSAYTQPSAPPLSMNNIKFKRLPFYEVMDEIIKPTILMGQERCTLPNVPRGISIFLHIFIVCFNKDFYLPWPGKLPGYLSSPIIYKEESTLMNIIGIQFQRQDSVIIFNNFECLLQYPYCFADFFHLFYITIYFSYNDTLLLNTKKKNHFAHVNSPTHIVYSISSQNSLTELIEMMNILLY